MFRQEGLYPVYALERVREHNSALGVILLTASARSRTGTEAAGVHRPPQADGARRPEGGPRWSARSATELAPEADAGLELQLRDRRSEERRVGKEWRSRWSR